MLRYEAVKTLELADLSSLSPEVEKAVKVVLEAVKDNLLVPVSVLEDEVVYVHSKVLDTVNTYLEWFKKYPFIEEVYLFGLALTQECTADLPIKFLFVLDDHFEDMDILLNEDPFNNCWHWMGTSAECRDEYSKDEYKGSTLHDTLKESKLIYRRGECECEEKRPA